MLKHLGKVLLFVGVVAAFAAPVSAIDTVPSEPPKVDGPFMITGYSFRGHSLHYTQIYNVSDEVAVLDGWKVSIEWTGGSWQSEPLSGNVEPEKKVLVADATLVATATFPFSNSTAASDPRLSTIKLLPPTNSDWNEHIVTITINDSTGSSRTPRVETIPATFYFARNISSSTGNYLTTFTAFVPGAAFTLEADPLYVPAGSMPLSISEIYPDATSCAPNDINALCYDYVKIYNGSSQSVDLQTLRLRVGSAGQAASSSNSVYLNGVLPPNEYYVMPISLTDSGSWVWLEDMYGMVRYDNTIVSYPSASSHEAWAWAYNVDSDAWQWTKYPVPYNAASQFSQGGVVNQCSYLRLSEIAANTTSQFIEVYNTSSEPHDISGCQLQTNRSQTTSFVFPESTILAANSVAAVDIASTELEVTKTTDGTIYILNSDGTVEIDARSYQDLDENTSLALVGGTWLQTFSVTPNTANEYLQYPPCEAGYERNVETGRCNKLAVATSLTPCLSTQYRSEETNRCRNIVSASTTLTPCGVGQVRNPVTNRCRSSATTAISTLKPCGPNQERNPLTNRCRTVPKIIQADFPVEAVEDTAEATIGWWAFGGVGLLAAGYAGWEWRHELAGFVKKRMTFFTSSK